MVLGPSKFRSVTGIFREGGFGGCAFEVVPRVS